MEKNKPRVQEEDTIDLLEVVRVLGRNILILLFVGLLFGAGFSAYTKFMVPATYTSTARMMVLTKETTLSSLADLQFGMNLTSDYSELIKSPPVMKQVVENLDLGMDYKALRGKVSISNPEDTRVLVLTVTDSDPARAAAIVNEVAMVSSQYISDIMEVTPPKIYSEGEVPTFKSGPNMKRNATMGVLLGIVVAAIIILIRHAMDDSLKSEEDIEKYLGLATLASIPDRSTVATGKSRYGYYRHTGTEGADAKSETESGEEE